MRIDLLPLPKNEKILILGSKYNIIIVDGEYNETD